MTSEQQRAALCQAVDEAFESEQVPFFERLVNQPSHTAAREDVEAAAAIIDEHAARLGLTRALVPDPEGRYADHRIYSAPAVGETDPAIALVGHCDTVYPRSQGFVEFRRDAPEDPSAGDHVYGPGVLDMKSGLSVVLFALQAVQRVVPETYAGVAVRFVLNTDEEVGSPSSLAMFDAVAKRTTMALVFEGGRDEDRIITARKGTGWFRLDATGREAHAGNDHAQGANAIHALALLVPRIEALTDYARGTTVNVGLIEGGTARNTVPGTARIDVDARVTSMDEARQLEQAMGQIAKRPFEGVAGVPKRLREVAVQVQGGIQRPPMEPTQHTQRLRRLYERAAEGAGLQIGEAPVQGGGSDASGFAAAGVPAIDGLGPYGKHFHSTREWSSLSSLRKRTQALAAFLASELGL